MKKAFFVALAAPCTLALTALGIYFANISELPGNPGPVCMTVFIQVIIGVLLLCLVQLPFLGRKVFPWIATILFTLGFLFWFQANVFNWDFGPMDGREIHWKDYRLLGIFELIVYGAIFCTALYFKNKLLGNIVPIVCILLLIQAVPVSIAAVKTLTQKTVLHVEQAGEKPEHNIYAPSWKQYLITFEGFFEFSPEENVVVIVLDAFGKNIFDEIQKEHPEEIEEIFHDFTCFTNVMSNRPGTKYNMPQILTGCSSDELPDEPDRNAVFQYKLFNREGALVKTLSEHQYRCNVFSSHASTLYHDSRWIVNIRFNDQPNGYITDTSEMFVLSLYRSVPVLLKKRAVEGRTFRNLFRLNPHLSFESDSSYCPLNKGPADYDVNKMVNGTSQTSFADQKTFKFLHLRGAHPPYMMDENCMPVKSSGVKEGIKPQALGSLRVTRNILELMKETGVYDQSLIIVMADHGSREPSFKNGIKHPIFFLKRKQSQQSQMSYNDNPVHIADTTPIILSELGILKGDDAFSPFEMPEPLVNERKHQWKIWRKK